MASADRAGPVLSYLQSFLPVYNGWTGEAVDLRRDLVDRLDGFDAAEADGVEAGALLLRAGSAALADSVAMLRAERTRLESSWSGAAGDVFADQLDAATARAMLLDEDVSTLASVAERHTEAVREILAGMERALLALPVPAPGLTPGELGALADTARGWPAGLAPDGVEEARQILDDGFLSGFEALLHGFGAAVDPCSEDLAELWLCFDTFVDEAATSDSVVLGRAETVVPPGPGPVTLGTLPEPPPAPG